MTLSNVHDTVIGAESDNPKGITSGGDSKTINCSCYAIFS